MTMQETDPQERLGGDDAPVRFSARPATNHTQPQRPSMRDVARSIEFIVFAVGVVAILIASAVDSGFSSQHAWTLIVVLAAAFILRHR
jgi:hypothetical protein